MTERVKNIVTFIGPDKIVRQIRKQIWSYGSEGRDFVFDPNKVIPLRETEKKSTNCVARWGCHRAILNDEEYGVDRIGFETEPAPPRKVFQALQERYPEVSILVEYASYDKTRFDGSGQILYHKGDVKESCVTDEYADIILHQMEGRPFSISQSFLFAEEKNREPCLKGFVSVMKQQAFHRLDVVSTINRLLTEDEEILKHSAVMQALQDQCYFLDTLAPQGDNTRGERDEDRLAAYRANPVWQDKEVKAVVKKNEVVKRSVLTRPKYTRQKRVKKDPLEAER